MAKPGERFHLGWRRYSRVCLRETDGYQRRSLKTGPKAVLAQDFSPERTIRPPSYACWFESRRLVLVVLAIQRQLCVDSVLQRRATEQQQQEQRLVSAPRALSPVRS